MQPRGATPRPRSGAGAGRTPYQKGDGQEELPRIRGQGGGREELPHAPMAEDRGGNREEQPHIQGAMAAWAQEGLEELSHSEGQEGQR